MDVLQLANGQIVEKRDGKYLTFTLDGNDYGIPILKVNEIIGLVKITTIPKTPAFVKGVINLRGKIIPVMDLRLKFGISEKEYDQSTCIIIANLEFENKTKQIGVIVDIVSEVCNILASDIEDAPSYGSEGGDNFISGIGKIKDKVVMLLDIERVIFTEELIHLFNEN